jgi:L-ribulose-5-phosphate 3-epimerase
MDTVFAFPTANFIARELGYGRLAGWRRDDPAHPFLGGWAECASAVRARFAPEEHYRQRLAELLDEVRRAGFDAVELWSGHLDPRWATDRQVETAHELLTARGIQVVGFHAHLGDSTDAAVRACRIAAALGTGLLTGGGGPVLHSDRDAAVSILADHGIRLAIENHPEHATPADLLAEVGDGADGVIGVNLDTGWWGTHGYDAVAAVDELAPHLMHVQLKDVTAAGAHDPCRLGEGCVPVAECLRALRGHGYAGAFSVEYLSAAADPAEVCGAERARLMHDGLSSRRAADSARQYGS